MKRFGFITSRQAFLYDRELTSSGEGFPGIVDEALHGWAVEILEETDSCYKIKTHYAYSGWTQKENVLEVPLHEIKERDEDDKTCTVIKTFTDILTETRVQGHILNTLGMGSLVNIAYDANASASQETGYTLVRDYAGHEGYVPSVALQQRMDSDGYLWTDKAETFFHDQLMPVDEDAFRDSLVAMAKRYLGCQYRWGGHGADGIDCSGLVSMSYMINGLLIYRDADIVPEFPMHEIRKEELKAGDAIFFPGHVAMYIGDNRYIHSTGHKDSFGCVINSLDPADEDYREDLPGKITKCGSIFG